MSHDKPSRTDLVAINSQHSVHMEDMQHMYGPQVVTAIAEAGLINAERCEEGFWSMANDYHLELAMGENAERGHHSRYAKQVAAYRRRCLDAMRKMRQLLTDDLTNPQSRFLETMIVGGKLSRLNAATFHPIHRQAIAGLDRLLPWVMAITPLPPARKSTGKRDACVKELRSWFGKSGFNPRKGQPFYRMVKLFLTVTEGEPKDALMKVVVAKCCGEGK